MRTHNEWRGLQSRVQVEKKSEIIGTIAMYSSIKYLLSLYQVRLCLLCFGATTVKRTEKSTLNSALVGHH